MADSSTKYYNFCYDKKDKDVDRREFMQKYNKQYRANHSATITCDCGAVYKEISKYTHHKTKRHVEFLQKAD